MFHHNPQTGTVAIEFDWKNWIRYLIIAVLSYAYGNGGLPYPFPQPNPPYTPPVYTPPPPPPPVAPDVPKQPPPSIEPVKPKADPIGAIVRVSFGRSSCTGIHLGDIAKSGHSYWLTAAHCTGGIGSNLTIHFQTGGTTTAMIVKRDQANDISIARSPAQVDYPFATLASELPEPDTPIWHRGYGVDRPKNYETGKVVSVHPSSKMLRMRLSVSSGDSGSSICREDTGEIVAVVYGTGGGYTIGGHCIRAQELIDSIGKTTYARSAPPPYRKVRVFRLRPRLRYGLIRR